MAASKKKKTAGSRAGGRQLAAQSKGTKAKRAPRAGKPRASAHRTKAASSGVRAKARPERAQVQKQGHTEAPASPVGETVGGSEATRTATRDATTVQPPEAKPTLPRPRTAAGVSVERG